jgi:hypothetical protein
MMDFFSQHWALAIDWVSVHAVTPVVNALHIAEAAGDPREIAAGILIALLQLFLIGCVMRPLESLLPAERWADRRHTTVDRNYTLLMLLGLFPLFSFLISCRSPICWAAARPPGSQRPQGLAALV